MTKETMNESLFSRSHHVRRATRETTQRRSWVIPSCARTTALALTLALLPAIVVAQASAPITASTLKATSATAGALCVGCPATTEVPAANSGAKLATLTISQFAAPTITTDKLYNVAGALTWNGVVLATGSTIAGTANTIGMFTGVAAMGDSRLTQSGTTVTMTGAFTTTGTNTAALFSGSGASLTSIPTSAVSSGNFVATVASGTGITSSVTTGNAAATAISLNNTAVTPGSYGTTTGASFTVDQQGRLTTAAGATITSLGTVTTGVWNAGAVTATSPIISTSASQAFVKANFTGAGALLGSMSTYGNAFLLYDETNSKQILLYSYAATQKVEIGNATTDVALGGANITDAVATPTINSGFGSGSSVAGKAYAFRVTMGTGSPTTGAVQFNMTFTNGPICVASSANLTAGFTVAAVTTGVTITTASAWSTGNTIDVICRGY
jgi:hypothetical protein